MAKQQEQLLLQVFAPFCSQIILPAKATPMLQLQYRSRRARKVVRTLGLKKQKVNIKGEKLFNDYKIHGNLVFNEEKKYPQLKLHWIALS